MPIGIPVDIVEVEAVFLLHVLIRLEDFLAAVLADLVVDPVGFRRRRGKHRRVERVLPLRIELVLISAFIIEEFPEKAVIIGPVRGKIREDPSIGHRRECHGIIDREQLFVIVHIRKNKIAVFEFPGEIEFIRHIAPTGSFGQDKDRAVFPDLPETVVELHRFILLLEKNIDQPFIHELDINGGQRKL